MATTLPGVTEQELVEKISSRFKVEANVQRKRRVWVTVDRENLIALCSFVSLTGFDHLSAISVTDWPEEEKYELTYHLWSYSHRIVLTIKTKIDRDNPTIDSVTSLWGENAQIHERELKELFGVRFEGNNDLSPLFLEDWDGPPPFRKDFDWRDHVRQRYYDRDDEGHKRYWE